MERGTHNELLALGGWYTSMWKNNRSQEKQLLFACDDKSLQTG